MLYLCFLFSNNPRKQSGKVGESIRVWIYAGLSLSPISEVQSHGGYFISQCQFPHLSNLDHLSHRLVVKTEIRGHEKIITV